MRWPEHAVETVRPSRFWPPFCPWPGCATHRHAASHFHRHGTYVCASARAPIPRFRCSSCKRTCSRQTFSTTYYLKRRTLQPAVAAGLVAGSAHRQIARSLDCAKTSVTRQAQRLARHAILFQAHALDQLGAIAERIAYDHFESFIGRQDRALAIGTPLGARSWFCYGADFAPHRRAGRPREGQPKRSAQVGSRPYVTALGHTLDALVAKLAPGARLELAFDGWQDYVVAVAGHPERARIRYRAFPNPERGPRGTPPTPETLARDRALRPVDAYHQLLRHSCAEHKRETIAFGRRLESIVGRAFLLAVWRNFLKLHRESRPRGTPAMSLGLAEQRWSWKRVLARRLFPSRIPLPAPWAGVYWQSLLIGAPTHRAKHAT